MMNGDGSKQTVERAERAAPAGNSERHGYGGRVDIVERTAAFADRVVRLSFQLPNNVAGWETGRQVVRAAMSVGANVEESQGAESKPDFLHKMKIARKECREATYFLIRIANAGLIPSARLKGIIDEADQLRRILTSIIPSTGGRKKTSANRS